MASGGWHEHELLAFDLETTGVDPFVDVPVSYALVAVHGGLTVWSEVSIVDPGRQIPAAAASVHGITTGRARWEGIPLGIAVRRIAETLLSASIRGVPIVGMKVDYDLTLLDRCYRREAGRALTDEGFVGPVLDALVIDRHVDPHRPGKRTLGDLCALYDVVIEHPHDAAADAKAAVDVVLELGERYPELHAMSAGALYAAQVGWHREWNACFAEWRRQMGEGVVADDDGQWPIAHPAPSTTGGQAVAI